MIICGLCSDSCRYAQIPEMGADLITKRFGAGTVGNVDSRFARTIRIADSALCLTQTIDNQYPLLCSYRWRNTAADQRGDRAADYGRCELCCPGRRFANPILQRFL